MNKRRYSNRRRKNILRVFILLMTIIITVVMWRTIKIDVQVGELTLPKILQSEKSFADTSGEWNLILVDRNHYIFHSRYLLIITVVILYQNGNSILQLSKHSLNF